MIDESTHKLETQWRRPLSAWNVLCLNDISLRLRVRQRQPQCDLRTSSGFNREGHDIHAGDDEEMDG